MIINATHRYSTIPTYSQQYSTILNSSKTLINFSQPYPAILNTTRRYTTVLTIYLTIQSINDTEKYATIPTCSQRHPTISENTQRDLTTLNDIQHHPKMTQQYPTTPNNPQKTSIPNKTQRYETTLTKPTIPNNTQQYQTSFNKPTIPSDTKQPSTNQRYPTIATLATNCPFKRTKWCENELGVRECLILPSKRSR